jgi:hypothetical protein
LIRKDVLVWSWIGEGFIKQEKTAGKSLQEIADSYFNNLINRSLIQAQFGFKNFCKRTVDSPSHRIFRRMYGALNIDKK